MSQAAAATAPRQQQAAVSIRPKDVLIFLRRAISPRALGLYASGETVSVAVVSRGLIRTTIRDVWSVPVETAKVADVILEQVARAEAKHGLAFTAVGGIPSEQCFCDLKPIDEPLPPAGPDRDKAIENLLPVTLAGGSSAAQATQVTVKDRMAALVWASPRNRVMLDLMSFFDARVTVDRLEPAPMASLMASFHVTPATPGLQIRLLVGPRDGLAFLLSGDLVLGCRRLLLMREEWWIPSIVTAIKLLEESGRQLLGETVGTILIQGLDGQPDAEDRCLRASMDCGLEVTSIPGPPFGGELIATGLALSGLKDSEDPGPRAPNMAAQLQGPPSWLSIVRVGEICAVLVMVVIMGLVLDFRVRDVRLKVRTLALSEATLAKNQSQAELSQKLAKEFDVLEQRVGFLDTKDFSYSEVLVAITKSIPANARLISMNLRMDASVGPNGRRLTLTLDAPDELAAIAAVRAAPALKPYFNRWQLMSLKTGGDENAPFAISGRGSGAIVWATPSPSSSPSPSPAGGKR